MVNIGITNELPFSEIKHVKLLNILAAFSSIFNFLFIPILFIHYQKTKWMILLFILLSVSQLLVLVLNQYKHYLLARLSFNLLAILMTIYYALQFGPDVNIQLAITLILAAAFFIYPNSQKRQKYTVIAIAISAYIFCELWFIFNTGILDLPGDYIVLCKMNLNAGVIIFLSGFFYYISMNYSQAETDLELERHKSESLLRNILPSNIVSRLKAQPETIADGIDSATILFADIVGFTSFSEKTSPDQLVRLLNKVFSIFDELTVKYEVEKIKTIGDAYMVAGGLPVAQTDHAKIIANMALDMLSSLKKFNIENSQTFDIRIGIHTGPVVAGVIGIRKFAYDVWGDTVNIASRMESSGISGQIQVSEQTYNLLKDTFHITERGLVEIKGKGKLQTYLLNGLKDY